jgi:hypothetical protein
MDKTLSSPVPLTEPADLREARAHTYTGQASWAIGPQVCGDCKFFRRRLERGSCIKARKMLMAQRVPRFPRIAWACRYFIWKLRRTPSAEPRTKGRPPGSADCKSDRPADDR